VTSGLRKNCPQYCDAAASCELVLRLGHCIHPRRPGSREPELENPMNVIEQTRPTASPIPGVAHATWAAQADGLEQL